ncbi:MAG: TIGR03862 family flavoprotein [Burkholderiaceae bacterium]
MKVRAAVVGGGPAGLMAAEVLAAGGAAVHVFDAMPSVGRKFLLAGKGGLNLTHDEAASRFVSRYGHRQREVGALLDGFAAAQLRDWAAGLGIDTFVGSSGRVFPREMKAAPLLRAWLHRLRGQGVQFHMRHRCTGLDGAVLRFEAPLGPVDVHADVWVLALGGGSWPRLGSDGAWWPWLQQAGVALAPLRPANCGFEVEPGWSEHFASRHAGAPLKTVALHVPGTDWHQPGECVVTGYGIEGSLVYAASALLRERLDADGQATLHLDLLPAHALDRVQAELQRPRGTRSLSTHLKSRLGLSGVKAGLLHELLDQPTLADPVRLASAIKALPLRLRAPRPLAEAISSAGGVCFEALDERLMLRALPGLFCAGEMLDWEAPTGGYLLTAAMASGRVAGDGALAWLGERPAQ